MENRIIKFRAWDIGGQRMIGWTEVQELDYTRQFALLNDPPTVTSGFIWMQFTGLLDKNGVEIYEGDVVRTKYDHLAVIAVHNFAMTCIALDEDLKSRCHHFPLREMLYKDDEFGNWLPETNSEVIGNIFETPELVR